MSRPSSEITTPALRHFILGTAGHIDHGKTALVRALTGIDTDRLPEEQRRGMTIELGFAGWRVADTHFGVVDVPGHEKFVRTMVAGATGIDIALLVVAADDSVMPQTVEHMEILQWLGVGHLVVALTKIDVVEPEVAAFAAEEVRELLRPTPWARAPIRPVSSRSGEGLAELAQAVLDVSRQVEAGGAAAPFRMAIDRVFTVAGRGTVVTGSILRGEVSAGDELELWPGGARVRVRDMQSHGAASGVLRRGQRAALNLSGVNRDVVQRGCELATPGYLAPTRMVDAALTLSASCGRALKSARVARLCLGTVDVPARIVLWEGAELPPGRTGYVQLRCGTTIAAAFGQRFILRDDAVARTLGGGIVLRPAAARKRAGVADSLDALRRLHRGAPEDRVEEVLRAHGFRTPTPLVLCAQSGVELDELPTVQARLRAAGRWVPLTAAGGCVVPAVVEDTRSRLVHWLERHHRAHPELPGRSADAVLGWLTRVCGREQAAWLLDRFVEEGTLARHGSFVSLAAHQPALSAADEKLYRMIVSEIERGGFQPPLLEALLLGAKVDRKRGERLATLAVARGDLVPIDPPLYLHADAERRLREQVRALIQVRGPQTVAEIREALQSSRKYVVPFVEYLDRLGWTRRVGERRELRT